jgi:hypothetical protein
MARLGECVLEKRQVWLLGVADTKLALRDEREPERAKQRRKFAQLAGVA